AGSPSFNHRLQVTGGVLADESAALLRQFFAARRG
ncbi:MAG TPA: tRNA-specific adenosine deaminase, partial [Gammaproteobacteria bacterium]|nr:tRNA-specific adenosine deaminase [Gammaproteobacteria bacterium]